MWYVFEHKTFIIKFKFRRMNGLESHPNRPKLKPKPKSLETYPIYIQIPTWMNILVVEEQ